MFKVLSFGAASVVFFALIMALPFVAIVTLPLSNSVAEWWEEIKHFYEDNYNSLFKGVE